jgi:hypothetical protein
MVQEIHFGFLTSDLDFLTPEMEMCNNPEECRSYLHHGRSLKSRNQNKLLKQFKIIIVPDDIMSVGFRYEHLIWMAHKGH